jgi:hypothetical protein
VCDFTLSLHISLAYKLLHKSQNDDDGAVWCKLGVFVFLHAGEHSCGVTLCESVEMRAEKQEVKLYIYHVRAQCHVGCAKITTAAPTFPFFF